MITGSEVSLDNIFCNNNMKSTLNKITHMIRSLWCFVVACRFKFYIYGYVAVIK